MLQHRMYGAGGFNRDDIANTVRTKVIDVFFKEHFAKTKKNHPLRNGGFRSRSDDSNAKAAPPL